MLFRSDLNTLISAVPTADSWSPLDAAAWWRDYEQALADAAAVTRPPLPLSHSAFAATANLTETQTTYAPRYLGQSIGTADVGTA